MGTDKAALPHPASAQPLILRQLDLLRQLAPAELLVSARVGQSLPPLPSDAIRLNDDGQSGPLGGIVAGLDHMASSHLLVVAVDLPDLDLTPLHRMISSLQPHLGAVPQTPNGLEPLIAIYPRFLRTPFTQALAAKKLGLRRLLQAPSIAPHFTRVTFDPYPTAFRNWNTPA